MLKAIRMTAVSVAVVSLFLMNSCNKADVEPDRTPELEKSELDAVLAKLEASGYDIDTTDLGIYYIVNTEGEGLFPQAGDTIQLEYTGYLLNGIIFDASEYHYPDGIWEFVFKDELLIPGFDDGISVMNKGAEIDMIIPSELAYVSGSYGIIKPYSTLLFSAKMHEIKPKTE